MAKTPVARLTTRASAPARQKLSVGQSSVEIFLALRSFNPLIPKINDSSKIVPVIIQEPGGIKAVGSPT